MHRNINANKARSVATSGVQLQRYYPGKAPKNETRYSDTESESGSDSEAVKKVQEIGEIDIKGVEYQHVGIPGDWHQKQSERSQRDEFNSDESKAQEDSQQTSSSEGSEDEADNIRELLRQRALANKRMEASKLERQIRRDELEKNQEQEVETETKDININVASDIDEDNQGSYESDESDGTESSYESEESSTLPMRPVFKSKNSKSSASSAFVDTSIYTAEEKNTIQLVQKKVAMQTITDEIKKELLVPEVDDTGFGGIDDTDYPEEEEAEYELWKQRELDRLIRDKQARMALELEREEVEKRRNMDERTRIKEDLNLVRKQRLEKLEKVKAAPMLGKYYHKGAFYSELLTSSKSIATAQEHAMKNPVDKEEVHAKRKLLEQLSQGRHNQTKWKGLKHEDTSRDSLWVDRKKTRK
ncbi:hypothetical protein AX774_g2722 [Zancudomyces culisetae]|uniref:Micro-fibrillar-associated protein 1 C-terminal domain-containing protein n=1 Tax=Zancudomyces culisetae TaxID=1213189 RepID=A0A1R1PS16_ZANCU|nr:hypothetical protein AX774_g2722 [Zancudomyces culisetae]|eukprot:OMH83757.1 hypothetical protein AX774_g2722 [Zancudomyces culisetae]